MYEVEVKAVLRKRNAVMKKLQDLGCKWSGELHQVDHVFIPEGVVFPPKAGSGVGVLRVRKQNDKWFFTLKISQSSAQDSLERELEISDGDKMINILKILKYQEVPTVEKRRIKTNYKDMEIVLDRVEQLGEFIEVEKIVEHENHEDRKKVKGELLDFLETIGVPKSDEVVDGKYDIMLFNKLKSQIEI